MITTTLLLMLFGTVINIRGSDVGEDANKVVMKFEDIEKEFKSEISGSKTYSLNQNAETTASTIDMGPPPPYSLNDAGTTNIGPPPYSLNDAGSSNLAQLRKSIQSVSRSDVFINTCNVCCLMFLPLLILGIASLGVIIPIILKPPWNPDIPRILTPKSTQSATLNNTQLTTNVTEQIANITEIVHNATVLTQNTSTALTAVTEHSSDTATTHGHVHIVRMHTSNAQLTVYIVAGAVTALLLIAVCILLLKMKKQTNKQDVFTDIQQYYTGGTMGASTAMRSDYEYTTVST